MLVQHLLGVHAVDVVGAEHDDVVGLFVVEDIEILEDGVGGAGEPAGPAAHLGRHRSDVVAQQRRQPPGLRQVPVEAVALVLGEHHDANEAGVHQVGQGEVDEPVVAPERHRRLGAIPGEGEQSLALAPGEHHHQHVRPARHGFTLADGPPSLGRTVRPDKAGCLPSLGAS